MYVYMAMYLCIYVCTVFILVKRACMYNPHPSLSIKSWNEIFVWFSRAAQELQLINVAEHTQS